MVFVNEAPAATDDPMAPAPPSARPLYDPVPAAPPRFLTVEEMLRSSQVREESVELDGWGWVRLREISKGEHDQISLDTRRRAQDGTWEQDWTAYQKRVVAVCLVEPHLTRDQIELLWSGAQDKTERLVTAIARLNRLGNFVDLKTGQQTPGVGAEPAATFPDQR